MGKGYSRREDPAGVGRRRTAWPPKSLDTKDTKDTNENQNNN